METALIIKLLALRKAHGDDLITVERDPVSGLWFVDYASTGHTGPDCESSTAALDDALERSRR